MQAVGAKSGAVARGSQLQGVLNLINRKSIVTVGCSKRSLQATADPWQYTRLPDSATLNMAGSLASPDANAKRVAALADLCRESLAL
jgi:hypothetical protein